MEQSNYAMAGLAIYIVVGVAKKAKLPTRYRMPLALLLAVATGAADVLVTGAGWRAAALGALLAGASAVGANEVREQLPGGRYSGAKGPKPSAALFVLLTLFAAACAPRTCRTAVSASAVGLLGFCRVAYDSVTSEKELAEVDRICVPVMKGAEAIDDHELIVSICERVKQ